MFGVVVYFACLPRNGADDTPHMPIEADAHENVKCENAACSLYTVVRRALAVTATATKLNAVSVSFLWMKT